MTVDAWMARTIDVECMKNIYDALEICLGVSITENITHTSLCNIQQLTTKMESLSIDEKQLCRANKRAEIVVAAQGYNGQEGKLHQVLMQARRRRYW